MRYEDTGTTSIRTMDAEPGDREAVSRLAQLDSHPELEAPVLGLEVEGRLLAAISLADGESVADPFSRTREMRALLELRADQLRGRERRRAHGIRRRGRALPEGASAAAGSIAGLPRWS